ncbi:MAG: alpha/beta fold hydrolase [Ruminococcaceae bacterium]|nr:alpha/beta fold hydrolase [Oscillospiraceae bacterium]
MAKILNKKTVISTVSVLLILALCAGVFALYVSDCYRADSEAIAAFVEAIDVEKTELRNGMISYGDPDAKTGFIFYPGGKVEYTAYEPLMCELASRGILCILVHMPYNLAVLDINAADGIREMYPKAKSWYIGGHSLGGAMAASYAEKHSDELEGLVLLAAYSASDISESSLDVLSIYGSEDGVMDRDKYKKYMDNLPTEFTEFELEGGCHAYFGMYGEQDGDGTAALNAAEQIRISAEYITGFMIDEEN